MHPKLTFAARADDSCILGNWGQADRHLVHHPDAVCRGAGWVQIAKVCHGDGVGERLALLVLAGLGGFPDLDIWRRLAAVG